MTDKPNGPALDRRSLLAGLAITGAAAGVEAQAAAPRAKVDAALRAKIDTVVVIYAENRSFNNLFADFPGLEQPLSAVPPERASAAPRAVATVIAVRGALRVQRGSAGPLLPLGLQATLYPGDSVRTGAGSEAALLFSDGSQVKLNADSSLRITPGAPVRPGQNLFQAILGILWARLRPGQRIQTPTGNIVVRGTEVHLTVAADGTTTLTVIEGDEWGDPLHDQAVYEYMKSYTPYENVRQDAGGYPRILAVTSLNDTRVLYVEPAKWAARLREAGADVLLKTEMSAGHGGVSGRYNAWRERAFELAWLLDVLGLAADQPKSSAASW